MSSDLFLPDTSAVLTMLDNEEGADIVEDIIRKKDILFPSIVLFEVYYITISRRSLEVAEQRYAMMKSITAQHIAELSEPVLLKGGEFKAKYHISLADSIIAGYSFVYDATLVHKDPEYEPLTMIRQVKLPYKSKY